VCAATDSKGTNPAGMRDFSRLATRYYHVLAANRSPGDARGAATAPAINAMTVAQGKRRPFQQVARATAKTSAGDLHGIWLIDRSLLRQIDFATHGASRKSAFLSA